MSDTEPARSPGRRYLTPDAITSVIGAGCVVLGGLVAAVAGPLRLADGSWVAAYLVLVGGVAQYAIARAPGHLGARPIAGRTGWALTVTWNSGNAAVIAGTVADVRILVGVGAVLLVAGLVLAWQTVRRPATAVQSATSRRTRVAYHGLLLVLLVSIPIGVVLAYLPDGH